MSHQLCLDGVKDGVSRLFRHSTLNCNSCSCSTFTPTALSSPSANINVYCLCPGTRELGGGSVGKLVLVGLVSHSHRVVSRVNCPLSQNWQIWVGNDTLWILFFIVNFPLNSLWIFHSHLLKISSFATTERDRGSDLSIYKVCPNWEHF